MKIAISNSKFIFLSVSLLTLWYVILYMLVRDSFFDNWLSHTLAQTTTFILSLLGQNASCVEGTISIQNHPTVCLANYCNGLDFMGVFVCLVVAWSAPWRSKLFFSFFGIVVIQLLNLFRLTFLALNHRYNPESFDINHRYTFIIIIYGAIFLMWRNWASKTAKDEVAQ
ncbi:MAG TPA: hypothetical protein DCR46_04375 [Cytophagales bacterium]|jgi:exosortase family protein XrtF|nr:hypothetical protein [Cytophagales bacterium]